MRQAKADKEDSGLYSTIESGKERGVDSGNTNIYMVVLQISTKDRL